MDATTSHGRPKLRISLRGALVGIAMVVLLASNLVNLRRLRHSQRQLDALRAEVGYLVDTPADTIAAVRLPSDTPLSWRVRIRVPENTRYRVAYSAIWPARSASPEWFSALEVPPGESVVTVQIMQDPRDDRWKITTLLRHARGNQRMATAMVDSLSDVFRQPHDVLSTGVGRETVWLPAGSRLRLLDDRWITDERGLLMYGSRAPDNDLPGVYVELQPDVGPLN